MRALVMSGLQPFLKGTHTMTVPRSTTRNRSINVSRIKGPLYILELFYSRGERAALRQLATHYGFIYTNIQVK